MNAETPAPRDTRTPGRPGAVPGIAWRLILFLGVLAGGATLSPGLPAPLGTVLPGVALAAGPTPEEAVQAETQGRWREAADTWRQLVEATPADAELWKRFLLALEAGGFAEELDVEAAKAVSRFPGWDEARVMRARALESRGDPKAAVRLLEEASTRYYPAAVERARMLLYLGEGDASRELYRSVVQGYDPGRTYTPRELLAVGLAAEARGDFKGAARTLETAYLDSLDFLPARLALGRLFTEKHQRELGGAEVQAAQKLAPRHPDVVLALARLSLMNNQFTQAERVARDLLELRPGDPGARCVLAQLDLIAGLTTESKARLREVLDVNPWHPRARALQAGAAYLEGDSTAYHRAVDELLEKDPGNIDVFLILGDILELNIRNAEAFAMYRRILAVDPENAEAWSALGQLTMREGREAEAREYLERGFAGDKFNIRAYNQLELLDEMDTYATYDFDRFRFRLDAEQDSVLVPLLRDRMETIWNDLTLEHGYTPENPTIVEIFPTHDWFSARVTGLAWIDGIPGVCFGDVVAMDSPRTLSGRTNWEQVLRHEFGHVLALGMTGRQVPFWFTEGLSVYLEQHPRGKNWDEVLVGALWDGRLVSVDSLTIAFTRPSYRLQRLLAYHQAGIVIGNIVQRKGWDAIPALLHAFGEGKTLREAVPEVLGESYADFTRIAERAVRDRAEWAAVWPAPDPDRIGGLERALERQPGDITTMERLAASHFQVGHPDDALRIAKGILQRDADNARALGIVGLTDRVAERNESAVMHLERAVLQGSRDLPVFTSLAEMALDAGDTTLALSRYGEAIEVYPYLPEAHGAIARLHLARGDTALAVAAYRTLLEVHDTSAPGAIELARIELEQGEGKGADEALEYALNVLPLDADVVALKGQALLLLDRDQEAYERFLAARRLDIRSVESMVGMARYYFKQEDFEEALYFAELALKYAPDHRVARRIKAASETAG